MKFFNTHIAPHARWIALAVAAVLVALLIFHAGLVAGTHQAPRPRGGMHGFRPSFGTPASFMLPDGYMPRGHGAVGTIATVTLPTLTITERSGDSETVLLATTTLIDSAQGTSSSMLIPGARVIIFGEPDETVERINAKVIHILP